MAGTVVAALVAAAGYAIPAMGAAADPVRPVRLAVTPRAIGSFTPAAADPRLAAALARAGLGANSFRFTPADARRDSRAITVAVRARDTRALGDSRSVALAAPANVALAPLAYSLGAAIGWKRFALSTDVTKVDLGMQPGSREAVDVGVNYAVGARASAGVRATAERPLPGALRFGNDLRSYSLDVGGSYALTRNLDVTAGLRYKTDRDRLERLRDDRRDSQAVYVGTAFKF